jgi:hypothetical protein
MTSPEIARRVYGARHPGGTGKCSTSKWVCEPGAISRHSLQKSPDEVRDDGDERNAVQTRQCSLFTGQGAFQCLLKPAESTEHCCVFATARIVRVASCEEGETRAIVIVKTLQRSQRLLIQPQWDTAAPRLELMKW